MRVLVATAMYPTAEQPAFGTFVATQVSSLSAVGVRAEPFVLHGRSRKLMYLAAVRDLRRRLWFDPPIDLIHAHYSYVGAVARMQRRVPVVLTFHGDDLLGTIDERGRTTQLSEVIATFGARLARHVDAVIVQSLQMADRLAGLPNVHILGHEVDLDLFRPKDRSAARRELGLEPGRRYVLFAASPTIAVKNYPLAEAAVARLRSEGYDVELLVVYSEPQHRLVDYMNASDVLVFPSYQEGSPNIVKQAMACNLPVVAADVGDVREVISATPGCAIVQGDELSFAAALGRVLDNPRRTNGRAAVAHLDCAIVASRLVEIYDEVLEQAGRVPSEVS